MTKRELFTALMTLEEVKANAEYMDGLAHEIELLNNKASKPKKPSKTAIENDGYKANILTYLQMKGCPQNIKEIQEGVPAFAEFSNQKMTRLLTDLVKNGAITKEYVKKTPFYTIAIKETAEEIVDETAEEIVDETAEE